MKNIQILKLISGEEIIGHFEEVPDSNNCIIASPLVILDVMTPEGMSKIMRGWIYGQFCDNTAPEIILNHAHVMGQIKASPDLIKQYQKVMDDLKDDKIEVNTDSFH